MKNIYLIRFEFDDGIVTYFNEPFYSGKTAHRIFKELIDLPYYNTSHFVTLLKFSVPDCIQFLDKRDIFESLYKFYIPYQEFLCVRSKFVEIG